MGETGEGEESVFHNVEGNVDWCSHCVNQHGKPWDCNKGSSEMIQQSHMHPRV